MANLYIIATPIGNLKDVTLRILEVLKEVDLILGEDTRVTRKLLTHYNIRTPILSYHQHSKLNKINYILELLKQEKNLALVSDSGTPGISDPGNELISRIVANPQLNNVKIIPIPGPTALIAAASVSGIPMDKFLFLGFPPTKRKRKKFFTKIMNSDYPVIFYESPYRILKTLQELNGFSQNLKIIVCRELTKKFETVYRGKIEEVIKEINPKGEFVVIVDNRV
ncbi:MAG: 16S rRNA (cytidine(1402)-2'-O)-methyltransferase [Candidatus Nealsonbacteria bacterium CG10_big_fil_rev_8_21_14_0_10_36_24]|uniref:Ribosomal RNA small subunit methyltransferase I n=2 Tax=Candidatus Nealsoniibacteriota TaxID=1817911 RepID=A0A2H0YMU9_9BACT|nr:MAG: 16S rRNA (cytidine(1402)-2'-O)-methyltransferase [Candidatus Nealsonbacteria bacterium CG10_big_fil_rev_8_21_14_0_10_36_24]PIS39824.1 MAG: 16S rRNA (cytidine(1402)-2'-O)-methyltransferase [Candidatus Nealsonbacteria bacterium CG08_land_8_20_14_0_20_36_22]